MIMAPNNRTPKIGFTCAYAPLAVIESSGFAPYRVLPVGDAPDQAGQWIHDNLCPHVKRILDRALADDLPELAGMVIVNSCDTMRRLADAWRQVRPRDPVFLLDLPTTPDDRSIAFFANEIARMADVLAQWNGKEFSKDDLIGSLNNHNTLVDLLARARQVVRAAPTVSGSIRLQTLMNQVSTSPFRESLDIVRGFLEEFESDPVSDDGVPIFLFGNMLPDPQAFELLEASGARIAGDDLCTGSRMFSPIAFEPQDDLFSAISKSLLLKPPCARTFHPAQPFQLADDILKSASACSARGVIGYTMKFCDPYLARLPMIQEQLQKEGLPLLLLEGDLSLGSIGQQRTRLEAFIEMLR